MEFAPIILHEFGHPDSSSAHAWISSGWQMEGRVMKSSTSRLPARMPTDFDELNALHPLRPIDDEIDLKNAREVVDRLAVLNKRNRDQNDYLEALIPVMEAYEAQEIADALDFSKSSGLDALKYLMGAHDMKQADLAKLLKINASAVSMISPMRSRIRANSHRTRTENTAKRICQAPMGVKEEARFPYWIREPMLARLSDAYAHFRSSPTICPIGVSQSPIFI
jgi:antitoxin component HigA of HigAB toxin-antitoxin module